ncbi:MAG: FG-GAP-like repeat-containing protein [Mariprofundaceae bacterium]|nr:FG-GAP-like repeat-containing protein [Mariprofundaceae bacterium]
MSKYIRTFLLTSLLILAACHAKVPPPSAIISHDPAPLGRAFGGAPPLTDIGPERVFPSSVPRFVDIDGDGHLDMLLGSKKTGTGFRVELGDGQGHWRTQTGPASNIQARAIAVADVDRDGRPEVLIGGEGEQHGLELWGRDAEGAWILKSRPIKEGFFHGLALHDLNEDGWPDIVAAGMGKETKGGIRVWLNDRQGGWMSGYGPTLEGKYTDLTVADLNKDGHADVVVASRGGFGTMQTQFNSYQQVGGVQIWLGDGNGHWDSRLLPVEGDAESVIVADIDGDGRKDVAAGLFRLGVHLWLNQSDGSWDEHVVTDSGTWGMLRVADIDGDGGVELLAASRDGRGIGVWRWQKSSLFFSGHAEAVERMLPERGVYFGIDAGAVFGDKQMQLAAAREDGSVEVWSGKTPPAELSASADGKRIKALPRMEKEEDLFHVTENKVFKTTDGVVEYRIGSGDEVSITMWQAGSPKEYKLLVQAKGTVSLPYFEAAKIEGMTAPEVDAFMTKSLSRYLRHPRMDVRVLTMKSKKVRVFGMGQQQQVNPTGGTFYLTGRETLVDLMSRIGAPAKDADFSRIKLVRDGKTRILDVQRAIRQSDESQNAVLDDGDTVVIPSLDESARQVYVLGEVGKPGVVQFHGEFHFLDAVSQSGGFSSAAYFPDIRVVRADREVPEIYAVAFDRLLKEGDLTQNMRLQDKDIIIVPPDPITNWNRYITSLLPTISTITSTASQLNALRSLLQSSTNANVFIGTGGL